MFQGEDKRILGKSRTTQSENSALYNQLGLAEYKAIEAFKRFKI